MQAMQNRSFELISKCLQKLSKEIQSDNFMESNINKKCNSAIAILKMNNFIVYQKLFCIQGAPILFSLTIGSNRISGAQLPYNVTTQNNYILILLLFREYDVSYPYGVGGSSFLDQQGNTFFLHPKNMHNISLEIVFVELFPKFSLCLKSDHIKILYKC